MLYAIISRDVEDSGPFRAKSREAHLARLSELKDQGRLILAGPFPKIDGLTPGPAGFSGSLIVAEFESVSEAELWATADPYIEAGVYCESTVKPFKHVAP